MSPFFTVLSLFIVASEAFASPFNASNWERCGTHATDAHVAAVQEAMKEYKTRNTVNGSFNQDRTLDTTINVQWHVIATSQDEADGWLSDETITNQLNVLTQSYAAPTTNVRFQLQYKSRYVSDEWFTNTRGSAADLAMRQMFGPPPNVSPKILHIYSVGSIVNEDGTGGILGYSSFPSDYSANPQIDGVVILKDTVPGGSKAPYDEGKTLVHEVGHWLGLLHTFHGGCTEPNDGIADTPEEASPAYGCPTGRDSCPNNPGLDPITNYMDYSDDSCLNNFTPDQSTQIDAMIAEYRS